MIAIRGPAGSVAGEDLRPGVQALHHRGPDGRGVWVSGDASVALGHTRLAIMDPVGGSQPICNEDGTVCASVNGEIYGFERQRRELEAKGHRFSTASDSEVLVHLYEERGLDALGELRGELAFVLYDHRRRRLIAARDRFGIKPLVWCEHGGRLLIASEAKALFACGVPAVWDQESFFLCASFQYLLPDRTLFDGVHQLAPGHVMIHEHGRITTRAYFDLDYPVRHEEFDLSPPDVLAAKLRSELDEAVSLRLRADVPVCCHVSGGLDSASVLALASRHATGPVHCFTVGFEAGPYDESAIAKEMAERVGAMFHEVRLEAHSLMEAFPEAVVHGEGLSINLHSAAKLLLAEAVRDAGFKVALTGEGADELFAGYAHFARDFGDPTPPDEVRVVRGIHTPIGEGLGVDAVERALGFVPTFLLAKSGIGRANHGVLSADFLRGFDGRDPFEILMASFDVDRALAGRHRVHVGAYLWTKLSLASYILKLVGDGAEMARSIEGRLPFLDHRLFGFAKRLPMHVLFDGELEKSLLRRVMREALTERIHRRRKHPFMAPPISGRTAIVQDMLRSKGFENVPFYDSRALGARLDDLSRAPTDPREDDPGAQLDPVITMALSAAILQDTFRC